MSSLPQELVSMRREWHRTFRYAAILFSTQVVVTAEVGTVTWRRVAFAGPPAQTRNAQGVDGSGSGFFCADGFEIRYA
jgi:hypothetical protein